VEMDIRERLLIRAYGRLKGVFTETCQETSERSIMPSSL